MYLYQYVYIYIYIYIERERERERERDIYTIDGNMYNTPLDLGSRSQRQMHSESG